MGRRTNNKKTTAFIKIVRSPASNASSFFRGRGRLQNLTVKLMVTLAVAYGVYMMKHPEASFSDVIDLVLGGGISQKVARDVSKSKIGGGSNSKNPPPDPKLPPCQ